MEAEIRERSRCRSFVHLLKAAKLLMAKEACGATNSSIFPFSLPSNLAVKLRLALCTRSPISKRLTKTDSADFRICAFLEGQMVVTNWPKLPPVRNGRSYRVPILAAYHARETRVQAQNVVCVDGRRGMSEMMWEMISDGRRISGPENEAAVGELAVLLL
jgi:hypothetical protein